MRIFSSLEELKRKLADFFAGCPEVGFAYLFGSRMQNRDNSLSDLDLAVWIDKQKIREADFPYGYTASLTSRLMSLAQDNRIDLVVLNEAAPPLKYGILTQGVLIFCRNPELERNFFIRSFHQYQDTLPLRRIQQFYMTRYLRNLGDSAVYGEP